MRDRFFPLFGLESPGAAVVATAGNLTEAPVGTFGNAAADAELAAVAIAVDLGTTEAAVVPGVVLPLKLALLVAPVPGAFAAGVGLLLVSVFLFRLTVFFLVDVMAPAFLASAPLSLRCRLSFFRGINAQDFGSLGDLMDAQKLVTVTDSTGRFDR